ITLILVSILGLILGMGLTITAAYIVLSIMAAPALVGVGIDLVVAHMICFWLSMTSALTPPIAIAAIVSAGIAKARPMMTAWHSMMLGVFLYLIPFTMAYAPQILVLGHTVLEVVDIIVSYVIVAIALASATQGWMFRNLRLWERVVFGATIPILMWASVITTLIGLAMFFAFAMFLYIDVKRTADTAPTATA
ncbi:MAG: TRAP transporter large permease subunit, partial [Oscillospiraceae bacterium]|nr:TRAP transporter large permease subunit [Oscillospiraceae bacterium]